MAFSHSTAHSCIHSIIRVHSKNIARVSHSQTCLPLRPRPSYPHPLYRPQLRFVSSTRQQAATTPQDEVSPQQPRNTTATKRKSQKPASLRRVAVEAQYSRDDVFIKRSGKRRYVDPHAETMQVTAYCAAEQYSIPLASHLLRQSGYTVDPFNTGLYPQVIHAQTPGIITKDPVTGEDLTQHPADLFVFPSGSIVTWNLPESQQQDLVNRILLPAAENPHLDTIEIEDLEYLEDASKDTSRIVGETIIIGTKPTSSSSSSISSSSPSSSSSSSSPSELSTSSPSSPESNSVLAKIAFSSGLARSTKLAVLENLLSAYFTSTRTISTTLSQPPRRLRFLTSSPFISSSSPFTRAFILRKTGELLSIRAQLNLYAELTDEMPDLFWDSPSSLGLSDYYDDVGNALDVNSRIRVLNEKIDYAGEIATVLRERLSEKHSTDLEWLIIFLISVEVVFELSRIWRERKEMQDPDSTDALLKEFLLRERARSNTAPVQPAK